MRVGLSAVVMALSLFAGAPMSQAQSVSVHDVAVGSRPAIAADNDGRLHAVFQAYVDTKHVPDIYYSQSTDGGVTWSVRKDISLTAGVSAHPDIAVEKSGALDVVWNDNSAGVKSPDIFFARSTDSGKTWSAPLDLSNTPGVSGEPAIAIGPDEAIHVVWSDTTTGETNRDIYYACSRDGGKQWSKDPLLPAVDISNTPGSSAAPAIGVGQSGVIHVAWEDTSPGDTHPDIYYARCEQDSWTKAVDVATPVPSLLIQLLPVTREASSSDNSKKEGAGDIWLAIAADTKDFADLINLSNTPGVSSEPASASSKGRLALVWSDTSTGADTPSIYARAASADSEGSFSQVINVSKTGRMDKHPRVTIAGDKMVAVWEDVTGGGEESTIKVSAMGMKGLASGKTSPVDPSLHGKGKHH